MKTITQTFTHRKDCKGSVVFEPVGLSALEPAICSSVYISRSVLPPGTKEVKLTLRISEGGADADYNAVQPAKL